MTVAIVILAIFICVGFFLAKPNMHKMREAHIKVLEQQYRIVKELNYQIDSAKEIKDKKKRETTDWSVIKNITRGLKQPDRV